MSKADVIRSLRNAIGTHDIEMSVQWAIELQKSGFMRELATTIEEIYLQTAYPLNLRFLKYYTVRLQEIATLQAMDEQLSGDNEKLTMLAAEVAAILAASEKIGPRRKHIITENDLRMDEIVHRLEQQRANQLAPVWQEDDPLALRIMLNELAGAITENKSGVIWYWIDWFVHWENNKKKTSKTQTKFATRLRSMDTSIWAFIANVLSRVRKFEPVISLSLELQHAEFLTKGCTENQRRKRLQAHIEAVLQQSLFPIDDRRPLVENTADLKLKITNVMSNWASMAV